MAKFSLFTLSAAAVLTLAVTACNQSEVTKSVDATSTGISAESKVEQAAWQQLTSEAKAALAAGDRTTAEAKFKAAIESARGLAADSPDQAAAIANLADFYYVQGDGAQANQLYTQSLAMHEKALGLMHVDLVVDLIGLAHVYSLEKKYPEARASLTRAKEILTKAGKPTDTVDAEMAKLPADK